MADSADMFSKGIKRILEASIDLDADTIKVMLLKDTFTPAMDTHEFVDDASGANDLIDHEYTGANYVRKTLLNADVIAITAGGKFDADDLTWTSLGSSGTGVKYAAVFKDAGVGDTSNPVICLFTLDPARDPGGGNWTLSFDAGGLFDAT